MVGALAARPQSWKKLIVLRWRSRVCRSTYLVRTSAGLWVPKILCKENYFSRSFSCTHKSAVARCLILPRPRLRQIPMAAAASVWISRASCTPRSLANEIMPKPWDAPRQIPPSSASALDRDTVLCVLDQCFRRWPPLIRSPPEVDLRVR